MPDPRHPKPYPRGTRHPKLPITPRWKALVRARLEENKRAGRSPSTQAELAKLIGADKAGLGKMLDTEQSTYKYARQISEALEIEDAMIENPAIPAVSVDELSAAVERLRKLPTAQQRQALAILETFTKQLDDR